MNDNRMGNDYFTQASDNFGTFLSTSTASVNQLKTDDTVNVNPLDIAFTFIITISICFEIVVIFFIVLKNELKCTKTSRNLQVMHILLCIAAILITFYTKDEYVDNIIVVTNIFLVEMFFSSVITAPVYPFKYETLSTRKIILIISCSWFFSAMFVVLSILIEIIQYHGFIFSACQVAAATLFLASSNLYMYIIAKKYNKMASSKFTETDKEVAKEDDETLRSAYICYSILLAFAALWLPFFIRKMMIFGEIFEPRWNQIFAIVVVYVALFNALLDLMLPVFWMSKTSSSKVLTLDVVDI